jgi:tryptophan synthase alpha chain
VPLAVGFGIGTGDQVRQVVEVADAAIVGSAIMRRVADLRGDDQIVDHISRFVSDLATGLPST